MQRRASSRCPELESLRCWTNQLTALNYSGCTGLTSLLCSQSMLTELDISDCTQLAILMCSGNPGDGTLFPIYAWFDNDSIPYGLDISDWHFEGQLITVDYRKKG